MALGPRWTLTDQSVPETYTFEINPERGKASAEVQYSKDVSQNINPTDMLIVLYAGQDTQKMGEFSGQLLSQAQYQAMWKWFNKTSPVILTDDIGRQQTIYFESLSVKRLRSPEAPWKHEFSVKFAVQSLIEV